MDEETKALIEPKAWLYTPDYYRGPTKPEPIASRRKRTDKVVEDWTETPLYTADALQAQAERDAQLVKWSRENAAEFTTPEDVYWLVTSILEKEPW